MIKLSDGRNELYQYDTGRTVEIDEEITQFHFSRGGTYKRTVDVDATVENGVSTAKIPDFLLQDAGTLKIYTFIGSDLNGYTKIEQEVEIVARNKPNDYVFTPTEQTTIDEIKNIAQSVRDDADAGLFDGFSPKATVEGTDAGATITIEDKTGTTTAEVKNGEGKEQVQSDYNQSDATQKDYIKNRPFYEAVEEAVLGGGISGKQPMMVFGSEHNVTIVFELMHSIPRPEGGQTIHMTWNNDRQLELKKLDIVEASGGGFGALGMDVYATSDSISDYLWNLITGEDQYPIEEGICLMADFENGDILAAISENIDLNDIETILAPVYYGTRDTFPQGDEMKEYFLFYDTDTQRVYAQQLVGTTSDYVEVERGRKIPMENIKECELTDISIISRANVIHKLPMKYLNDNIYTVEIRNAEPTPSEIGRIPEGTIVLVTE